MAVADVRPETLTGMNPGELAISDAGMLFSTQLLAARTRDTEGEGTRPPGENENAPRLDEYTQIEDPGKSAPDTIRFKKEGSDSWVVVAKASDPLLYEQVVADHKALGAVRQSEQEGYVLADDDDTAPAFNSYKAIGPQDELADGTVRYEVRMEDGSIKKIVVSNSINPELYDTVSRHSRVLAEVNRWQQTHYTLAGADDKAPPFEFYIPESIKVDSENGIVTYITDESDQVIVVRDANPQMYEDVISAKTAHDALEAGHTGGYERPPSDLTQVEIAQVGPPGEFGEGVIRFSTKDGKKYVVNKFTDPALYSQAVANYESTKTGEINRIREKFGLPALDGLDVLSLSTGEKSDPDKDDSEFLTVGEYAVTKLLEDYREGVKSGKYAKDSVQAKLVRGFEAKAALASGRDITPYAEKVMGGGSTSRDFGDPVHLTDEDMHDIIDANSVDHAITALLSDETVAKDYESKLDEGVKKIPQSERTKLATDIAGTLESAKYVEYLAELDKRGLKHMGSKDTSTLLTSLALLDEEKAGEASQTLMLNTLTHELNTMDPSKISEENQDLALKDTLYYIGNLIKAGGNAIRTGIGTWEKFIAELAGDKTKLSNLRKVLTETFPNGVPDLAAEADRTAALAKIDGAINKYIPSADRAVTYQFMSQMASSGFLGSMAGGISLFGSIYQLAGKGGALAETPQQRLAIANGFISFLSMGSHFVTLGDKILNQMSVSGLADVMGMGKSLPEIWGKKGLYDFETKSPFRGQTAMRDEISATAEKLKDDFKPIARKPLDDAQLKNIEKFTTKQAGNIKVDLTKMPDTVKKIAASVLKVTGAVTDFAGGVLDIVMGAMTINSAIKSGNALEKTAGALQIISGTMGLGAGAIGVAALMGNIGAVSAAMGPLFLIGAFFAFIGGIIGMFVDHNKRQAATDKEGQWFKDAAGDGLLYTDWGDKVEYARYATKVYENRDAPEDESIFDFQHAEWEHFRTTPGKNGSSINRLDKGLHIDYDGKKQSQGRPDDTPAWRVMRG